MILNLDDLTVTTFTTTPGDPGVEPGDDGDSRLSNTCPPSEYLTNCLITCITCAAGCESGSGANC
jgi:hypothetical protein